MQEQGSPFQNQLPPILVVSGPQDERAIALVQTLRDAGLHVIFASTVTLAARAADEATACVAVLRPDTWKAQTIATVMRAKPTCLIPVLAEPMSLPRGPWTQPAITLVDNPEQGEQEVIQILSAYLATHTAPTQAQSKMVSLNSIRITRLRPRRRRKVGALITTIALLLLILGLGGLFGYHAINQAGPQSTANVTGNNPLAASSNTIFNAPVPGPGCNNSSGQWETGDRYIKTVNKKKVEVLDKYTTLQCQSDGALLTRSGDYDVYSELYFDGSYGQNTLAPHYLAQVSVTIINGDAQADVAMDAHIQAHTYGRYGFDVDTLGRWEASIGSPTDGSPMKRMAIGFLPKTSQTYTLAIDVNGPTMTFFINGLQITTVTDSAYTDNNSVAFGISDSTASKPISALFSSFQYEVLPNKLTPAQAIATATAVAQNGAQAPYSARVPGYNCDKGVGQWQPLAEMDNPGQLHCLSNGMQLTDPANAKIIAEEEFYWLNGYFPQNYKVAAQVDVSAAGDGCAGLGTRESSGTDGYGSYHFVICSDGSWAIVLITNKFQTLAQGTIYAQSTYTIAAKSNGSAQSLYIDGNLIKTVTNTHLTSTDHISLDVGLYSSHQTASATFSDFIFTPLP